MLRRWIDLDYHLVNVYGLHLPSFAKRWRVSRKTIRRDLAMFKELGYPAAPVLESDGIHTKSGRCYVWSYPAGTLSMFTREARVRCGLVSARPAKR